MFRNALPANNIMSFSAGIVLIITGVFLLLRSFDVLWLLLQGILGLSLVLAGYFLLMSMVVRKK